MDFTNISKFSPPQHKRLLQRDRLFSLLDGCLDSPVTWISAAAGSGKTQLVASYLLARKRKSLWFQITEEDSDLASFFFYLGKAAAAITPSTKPFPLLTPEYTQGTSTFSRRFAEKLHQDVGHEHLIVFDDIQEIADDDTFHRSFIHIMDTLPPDHHLLVISRCSPPPPYSRLILNNRICLVDTAQLQLNTAELLALASLNHINISEDAAAQLLHISHGWMVGSLLLLQQGNYQQLKDDRYMQRQDILFNYFLQEIFYSVSQPLQQLLLATAYLPAFSLQDAERLLPQTNLQSLLADLVRCVQFVTRHGENGNIYRYHPLLREFLLSLANEKFLADEQKRLRGVSSAILIEQESLEKAAELLIINQDWQQLSKLMTLHARKMIEQGRNAVIKQWASVLPASYLIAEPWINFWLGSSIITTDVDSSRRHLSSALELFRHQQNKEGIYLSWAGIVRSYTFAMDGYRPLDHWFTLYDEISAQFGTIDGEPYEATVANAMFTALVMRQPNHPRIESWRHRAYQLALSSNDQQLLVTNLFDQTFFLSYMGYWSESEALINHLLSLIETGELPEPLHLIALFAIYISSVIKGDHQRAITTYQDALELTRHSGIHIFDSMLSLNAAKSALFRNDVETAEALIRHAERFIHATPLWNVALYHSASAHLLVVKNRLHQALHHNQQALQITLDVGNPLSIVWEYIILSQLHTLLGDYAAAGRHAREALKRSESIGSQLLIFSSHIQQAILSDAEGDEPHALQSLRQALSLAEEYQLINTFTWHLPSMLRLLQLALANDIHTGYSHYLIRHYKIPATAPSYQLFNWPFPIMIYTFGGLRLVINDKEVSFKGKVQKKPLHLLMLLLCTTERGLSDHQIIDALWPDAEGDAGYRSLSTTLHRLRKLLGHDDAILHANGLLSINQQICWLDIARLEYLISLPDNATLNTVHQIFSLLKGAFLHGVDAAWSIYYRHHIGTKLLHFIETVAPPLCTPLTIDEAIALYELGLEYDPDNEPLYHGLISCYLLNNNRIKALTYYHHYVNNVCSRLQIKPSQQLVNLVTSLTTTAG